MKKILVSISGIVLLVVVALVGYLFFRNATTSKANPNNFEIQGMKVEVLQKGSGGIVINNDYVVIDYVGQFADGKVFDSSIDRKAPFSFTLGKGTVIKGWNIGIIGMKVGETRKLTVPPPLAYGQAGYPPTIPPNATLTYTIDLLKIQ